MGAGGKGIMLRSEWDVLPFLESGKRCEYCRSMHKAPISGLFTGSALSQHEITCLCGISGGMVPARLGKPDEGYQVM